MTRIAIVTGGAGGLGRLITLELARGGAHVVAADVDTAAGGLVVEEVAAAGGSATFVETDASDPDHVSRMVEEAAHLGDVTTLVNNAGGWLPGPQFPDTDAWRRALDLNLAMPMLATQLCIPHMSAAGGGAVVNVSSSGGTGQEPYGSPEYGAAKAGLIRFTTAAADLAHRFGVRVSCVVPHWIGLDRALEEYAAMSLEDQRASGGLVDPHVVVAAVVSLVRDPGSAGVVVEISPARRPG